MIDSKKPVRLTDIAAQLGVSRTTVSGVLLNSGGKNLRVSEEIANKIKKLAKQMGYVPNTSAQRLAGKDAKIIGVIIDSKAPAPSFKQLSEIERIADQNGYRLIIGQSHGEIDKLEYYSNDFIANGVAGVICVSHDYPDCGAKVADIFLRIPHVIFIGRPLTNDKKACWISINHEAAITKTVEHLVQTGKKSPILFLSDNTYLSSKQKIKSFKQTLKKIRFTQINKRIIHWAFDNNLWTDPSFSNGGGLTTKVQELMQTIKPDCIVTQNDIMAAQFIRTFLNLGYKVPEDIAVTGCDNLTLTNLFTPAITTIDLQEKLVAKHSMEMMFDLIKNGKLPRNKRCLTITPKLIIRESSAQKQQ